LFSLEDSYSVVLPEKLDTGKWNVYRFLKNQSFLCCYVWFFDKCVWLWISVFFWLWQI